MCPLPPVPLKTHYILSHKTAPLHATVSQLSFPFPTPLSGVLKNFFNVSNQWCSDFHTNRAATLQFQAQETSNVASSTLTTHQTQPVPRWPPTIRGGGKYKILTTGRHDARGFCTSVGTYLLNYAASCPTNPQSSMNVKKLTKTVSFHKIPKPSHCTVRPRQHTWPLSQPVLSTREFILALRSRWDLRSSGMLSSV